MRPMSELALGALAGSRVRDRIVATVWYDGRVVVPDLPVSKWTVTSDAGAQVQTRVSLEVTDGDGALSPWAVDDPLGVGGAKVQLSYRFGGGSESVDVGWFRTTASDPVQRWRKYDLPTGEQSITWVSSGATIPLACDDLTQIAKAADFLAPQSPPPDATAISEVRRLLAGIVPVTVVGSVIDADVPTTVIFETKRMDAIDDLVGRIGCAYRMTGDGQLEIYPTGRTEPVWEVSGGDEGALIAIRQAQSVEGLYNAAVVEGQHENGTPLLAIRTEETGPLRWEGPHWQMPVFLSSTGLLKTQEAVDAAAKTLLAGRIQDRTVTLNVECLPHPGLQVGDTVRVVAPTVSGRQYPLDGVVRSLRLSGSTNGVDPMTLAVECSYEDVQAMVFLLRR